MDPKGIQQIKTVKSGFWNSNFSLRGKWDTLASVWEWKIKTVQDWKIKIGLNSWGTG